MIDNYPDLGAFVFECANMPAYSAAIRTATGLPVFDLVTLTKLVYYAVLGGQFQGFM